jgi:[pyruvate, water dikinase]-phosphate phosphotransferase / [pyruvate, water dikinase] kinase
MYSSPKREMSLMSGSKHEMTSDSTGTSGSSAAAAVYIVSGNTGSSGNQLVNTVLAQFPDAKISVKTLPHVRTLAQIEEALETAAKTGSIVVHTLVDRHLREAMIRIAKEHQVHAIDLMGELIQKLSDALGREPEGRPGLYRRLNRQYFERIEAIEFAINHDDGMNVDELGKADIVLVGVSRVGKTPITMYLAMLGWNVANVPFIPGQSPPKELKQADKGRVIGFTVDAEHLVSYRKMRHRKLGIKGQVSYTDLMPVFEEVEEAFQFFRRNGYSVIDVTDKPLEASSGEVLDIITSRFGQKQNRADISSDPG